MAKTKTISAEEFVGFDVSSNAIIPKLSDHSQPIAGLNVSIGDFWRWAYSDFLSTRNRSVFAEFLVAMALGVVSKPRVESEEGNLEYHGFKIEVKSAAYCQSWHQTAPSCIQFSIRRAAAWNPATGKFDGPSTRCAKVHVFCHFAEQVKTKANVLNIPSWNFYVIPTEALERTATKQSLSLEAVKKTARGCKWSGLKREIDLVLETTARAAG